MKKLTVAAFAAVMLAGSVGASANWVDDLMESFGFVGTQETSCKDHDAIDPCIRF